MEDVRQWTALVVFDAEDSRPKALVCKPCIRWYSHSRKSIPYLKS